MLRRTLAGLVLGLVAALAMASTATADTPVTTSGAITDDAILTDCGAFDLHDRFVFEWNGKMFFDSDGNLTRVVEHVGGSDTFYNSVTGKSVTGTINAGETVDLVKGTVTENGTIGRITVPGEGAFFFDVGKFVIDFDEGLVFLAGSHHAFFDGDYSRLCELLA